MGVGIAHPKLFIIHYSFSLFIPTNIGEVYYAS
jgi:hypothetical protein